jgi:hypothetical protein
MKQCKALIVKEWNTHRTALLMPVWFTVGVYISALLGWIISLLKGEGISSAIRLQGPPFGMDDLMLYGITAGSTALLGIVAIISAITLADSLINGGYKRRCEILHFSQPVSFIKIAGVKHGFMSLGMILLYGLISLVNTLVITAISGQYIDSQFYYAITGWLQSWASMSLTILLLGSLFWFFAAIFKRKSFFFGVLVILGIQVVISILNYTAGWHIPSLLEYLSNLISLQINFDPEVPQGGVVDLDNIIKLGWQNLISWTSLLKLAYSTVLCAAGAWIYKIRELT